MPDNLRVLFVTPCAFNHITGGGVTFSNLFQGWPKERIAAVTDDPVAVSFDVCEKYYFLSGKERRYIAPFGWFYRRKSENLTGGKADKAGASGKNIFWRLAKYFLNDAGIPERGVLTDKLRLWIKEFNPDIIYTILGTSGYIDLVRLIQKEFGLPVVVHLMDEGVTDPRPKGLFGHYIRKAYARRLKSVLKASSVRIAICDDMARAYQARYGYDFRAFQNTLDLEKWEVFRKKDFSIGRQVKILYAGSVLSIAHLESLKDSFEAVARLRSEGHKISFDIYTPLNLLREYPALASKYRHINFHGSLSDDEEFFRTLAQADILLLPANFSPQARHYLRYSMPTKVPAYLASGVPILVYGPADIAQVKYALRDKWGYVVSSQGIEPVKKGIIELIAAENLRRQISRNAGLIAAKNHNSKVVRSNFQDLFKGDYSHAKKS